MSNPYQYYLTPDDFKGFNPFNISDIIEKRKVREIKYKSEFPNTKKPLSPECSKDMFTICESKTREILSSLQSRVSEKEENGRNTAKFKSFIKSPQAIDINPLQNDRRLNHQNKRRINNLSEIIDHKSINSMNSKISKKEKSRNNDVKGVRLKDPFFDSNSKKNDYSNLSPDIFYPSGNEKKVKLKFKFPKVAKLPD